ncbi:DUF1223 domain-containing protein [Litorivicinus lipolyticus]|uniref:DUF1223 domain-containing protein n=1 Tax=Litorivicinus lipolyticus TaxID=418701 RepID=A0A5Q2QCR0_9GAMM|nr:DUF1223 domain-containing protein [Litorivicinus lipolyticus]QGG79777.1 DUF1223 domain-containing protein [Litorivicinus lipolyticus]
MQISTLVFFSLALAFGANALAADAPARRVIKPQAYLSPVQAQPLFELFQSEADPELPWGHVALRRLDQQPNWVPIAWHVQWRHTLDWPDGFAKPTSDARQDRLVAAGAIARFTPQSFINGHEWRGLLQGDAPPSPRLAEVGALTANIYPSGVIIVEHEPGPDFRHIGIELVANLALLAHPESRIVPIGPAAGVSYLASHSVILHEQAPYDPRLKRWRFKLSQEVLWPLDDPEPRLAIWIEPAATPRPIQSLLLTVKPKPPPPEED